MAADAIRGKDMKKSAKREFKAVKHRAADFIESVNPLKETKKNKQKELLREIKSDMYL